MVPEPCHGHAYSARYEAALIDYDRSSLCKNNGFTSSLLGRLGETQTEPPLLRLASRRDPATQHQPVYDPMVFDANIEVRRVEPRLPGTNFVGPV